MKMCPNPALRLSSATRLDSARARTCHRKRAKMLAGSIPLVECMLSQRLMARGILQDLAPSNMLLMISRARFRDVWIAAANSHLSAITAC
jgi:hypothetical protein